MEFLVIMAVGTAIAVWAVIASRPKGAVFDDRESFLLHDKSPGDTPPWKKDAALSHPIGELEYLEGVERYENDPAHQPVPLPPPRITRDEPCD
jgi:hypothetical protein